MEIAVFLRESGDIDNEQWHKFSRRFFTEYRDTIMQYYGYESQLYYAPPRVLVYPRFFIAVMSVLLELGIIRAKKGQLVKTLCGMFCFDQELSTVRRWFYEMPPEYEEILTTFKDLIYTLKIKK